MHVRGNFREPGIPVEPGIPAVLPPLEDAAYELPPLPAPGDYSPGLESVRAAAGPGPAVRWLIDSKNPLTARVAVNRQWQELFGRGIVATSEDFGTQGSLPSHPELLDWLDCEFRDRGWSLKALHRLIVTSATYRQSSVAGRRWRA